MKCPACSSILKPAATGSGGIRVCAECRGIWFACDQFVPFVRKLAEDEDLAAKTAMLFEPRRVVGERYISEQIRTCPDCTGAMKKFNYAYDSNIILDRCKDCGGIWADCGEVTKAAQHIKGDHRVNEIGKELLGRKTTALDDMGELTDVLQSSPFIYMPFAPRIIIPLGDDQEREKTPWMTISLIVACVAVFAVTFFLGGDRQEIFNQYGWAPARLLSIGLLTSMFLHGGLMHLLGNMYFLWLFGDNVEDRFSWIGYLLFYLGAELAANALHAAFNFGSTVPSVGASGAISGVMGAYMVFYPSAKIKMFFICRVVDISAVLFMGAWFGFQVFNGLLYTNLGFSNIAWFAHVGGFLFGAGVAYIVKQSNAQSPAD